MPIEEELVLLALSLEIGFHHSPDGWSMVPGGFGSWANKEYKLLMVEVMLRAAPGWILCTAGVEDAQDDSLPRNECLTPRPTV